MVVYELLRVIQFVFGYGSLISVTVGIWVWEAAAKAHLSADLKWGIYAGAFVSISFLNWRAAVKKAERAETALREQKERIAEKRVFARDADELLERYDRLPSSRRISYLDQWITVAGKFEGAAESLVDDAMHVSVLLESGRRVPLQFPAKSRDRLKGLREGQGMRAICQVRPGPAGFALQNAELA